MNNSIDTFVGFRNFGTWKVRKIWKGPRKFKVHELSADFRVREIACDLIFEPLCSRVDILFSNVDPTELEKGCEHSRLPFGAVFVRFSKGRLVEIRGSAVWILISWQDVSRTVQVDDTIAQRRIKF